MTCGLKSSKVSQLYLINNAERQFSNVLMRFNKSPEVCLLEDVPKLSISSSVCLSIMLAI